MHVSQIDPGVNPPDDFNPIIEIPTGGQPVKEIMAMIARFSQNGGEQ